MESPTSWHYGEFRNAIEVVSFHAILCKGLYVDSALHILGTLFDFSGMDRECLLFYVKAFM